MRKQKSNRNTKAGTAIFFAVLVFVNLFICNISFVFGNSMSPALHNRQIVAVLKLYGTVERGDIVITDTDNLFHTHLIKRVIALGGETVHIENAAVWIDGKLTEEPYCVNAWENAESAEFAVPEGSVFLMGDNRDFSRDSREIGAVAVDHIIGKVLFQK